MEEKERNEGKERQIVSILKRGGEAGSGGTEKGKDGRKKRDDDAFLPHSQGFGKKKKRKRERRNPASARGHQEGEKKASAIPARGEKERGIDHVGKEGGRKVLCREELRRQAKRGKRN